MMTVLLLLFWDCSLLPVLLSLITGSLLSQAACLSYSGIILASDVLFYTGFTRFIRKSRPVNLLIVIISIKEISEIIVLILLCRFQGTGDYIMHMIMLAAYPFFQSCRFSFRAPGNSEFLPRLQAGILILCIFRLFSAGALGSVVWLPLALATILLLTMMILSRTVGADVVTSHRNAVVWAVLGAYALIGAAFAAAFPLARLPYDKAITAFLSLLGKVLVFVFHYLSLALDFFFSLFPEIEQEIPEITEESVEELPRYMQKAAESNPVFAFIFLSLLLLFCGYLLYRKFRGHRLGRINNRPADNFDEHRGKWNPGKLLKTRWDQIRRAIGLKMAVCRNRNTCMGCYLWLVNRSRKTAFALRSGETPHAYLERLSRTEPSLHDDFLLLQRQLDEEVYGGRKTAPLPCPEIRKKWSGFLRQQKHAHRKHAHE